MNPRDNVGDGGVIRLSPARSKTLVGRILPISPPIADALDRRRARRDPGASVIKCCYAATGMYMMAAAAILRELKRFS